MSKSGNSGATSTRRSVCYYPQREQPDLFEPGIYRHMFEEDIHLGIMPIGAQSTRHDFAITLVSSSAEVQELLMHGLPPYDHEAHSLTEAVCSFVDEAAHMMGLLGRSFYEIVYMGKNLAHPTTFSLQQIQSKSVHGLLGLYWQYVPRKVRTGEGGRLSPLIRLPNRDLMILSFPAALGGVRGHHKLMRGLSIIDKSFMPRFLMDDMELHQQTPTYDSIIHKESLEIYLGKTTRRVGWNARSMQDDTCLEYYRIYRYVKFERSKALLREYILDRLNTTISKIGRKMGFKAQIQVQGLPSSKDLYSLFERLDKGEVQFSEAFDATRY